MPALAIASLAFIEELLVRRVVRLVGLILAAVFFAAAAIFAIAHVAGTKATVDLLAAANLHSAISIYVYLLLCGAGLVVAWTRAPLVAWPVTLGSLALVFSYFIAPAMNPDKSGKAFVHAVLLQVERDEEFAFVAYKEQFLLYVDRPTGERDGLLFPEQELRDGWTDRFRDHRLITRATESLAATHWRDGLHPCRPYSSPRAYVASVLPARRYSDSCRNAGSCSTIRRGEYDVRQRTDSRSGMRTPGSCMACPVGALPAAPRSRGSGSEGYRR